MDSFYKKKNTEHKWKEAKIHLSRFGTESILPMDNLCNLIISVGVKMLQSANLEIWHVPVCLQKGCSTAGPMTSFEKRTTYHVSLALKHSVHVYKRDSPLAECIAPVSYCHSTLYAVLTTFSIVCLSFCLNSCLDQCKKYSHFLQA